MPTSHADRARLAHRVLRLRENGITDERTIRQLAGVADRGPVKAGDPQQVMGGQGHPLGPTALHVVTFLDDDRPGPTDRKLVEKLMGRKSLGDIWDEWNDAVTANLEATLDDGALKAWRESVVRDQEAAYALWEEAGLGPEDVHPYFGHARHLDGAANALYDLGRQGFLDGSIQIPTPTIKVALVDAGVYAVNLATHQFMSSVASVVATSPALTTKTVTAGVFDADDITFTAVSGAQSEALIIYQSSAVAGGADVANTAQRLIAYIDTATGLPVTPNGGNITVAWDSGSNRIFKL